MFDYFRKASISNRANDELLYEYVLSEMESNIKIKGLWGKALANSNGDDNNAKSLYMKYRVQSIKDIFTAKKIAYNELTKPKLFQYIEEKILPPSDDYIGIMKSTSEPKNYKVSKYEESIYEEVANELSNDIRKEGLWLKSIQNTNGDENKALSLYIKYRSESLKKEKADQQIEQEKLENQKLKKAREVEKKKLKDDMLNGYKIKIGHFNIQPKIISDISDISRNGYSLLSKTIVRIDGTWDDCIIEYDFEYKNVIYIKKDNIVIDIFLLNTKLS